MLIKPIPLSPNLITLAFTNDTPIIDRDVIEAEFTSLEGRLTKAQTSLVGDYFDTVLEDLEPALRFQNANFIREYDNPFLFQELTKIYGDAWQQTFELGTFHSIDAIKIAAPNLDIRLTPSGYTNTIAEAAISTRNIRLAGSFSAETINELKTILIASITPDSNGRPITRQERNDLIRDLLTVSDSRASLIARTETTAGYNTGRVFLYNKEPSVTHVRFLAIFDTRTSAICRSRNGMVIPMFDVNLINANTPPLHGNCRSVLSPLLPDYNPRHKEMVENPDRSPQNLELVPLPDSWRTEPNPILIPD